MAMPFYNRAWLAGLAAPERDNLLRDNLILGSHPATNDYLMMPNSDRFAGMYVLGSQGTGKSAFLETLISQDVSAGNAIVVLDPHGDLIQNCIAALPPQRVANAFVLDMLDEEYPYGINLFSARSLATDADRTQAANRIIRIFNVLWPETVDQQNLPNYVRSSVAALLANQGATLADMGDFLTEYGFRQSLLRAPSIHESVHKFWRDHDALNSREQDTRIAPLMRRLNSLFMGRSLVQNILGQRKNSIDFRRAIENKEFIFVKLPLNQLGQDAQLLGMVIISLLYSAVFSFADTPEPLRPGVSIYVDEFQNFNTDDFATLFTEGRKFGMRLIIAHQYRKQISSDLQHGTMTARTKVCFQISPDDAHDMAHLFVKHGAATLRPDDVERHPVNYLLEHESPIDIIHAFTEAWLRPLKARWGTRRVKITDMGFSVARDMSNIFHALITPKEMYEHPSEHPPEVPNPLEHVDALLRQAMQSGNPWLPIPAEAVLGFANTGRSSFYSALPKQLQLLNGTITYPPDLIGNGMVLRDPRDGLEELYVLLFLLRGTMLALAAQPIGQSKGITAGDVAQKLNHLPPRHAYVRSNQDIGLIFTLQTPTKLDGQQLTDRLRVIRQQTRDKYCRPRAEIDRIYAGRAATAPPPPSQQSAQQPQKSRWDI